MKTLRGKLPKEAFPMGYVKIGRLHSIVEFNRYTNSPIANYKGKLYNLPFNMNTFYQMWGVTTPAEAIAKIEEQKAEVTARITTVP